MTRRVVSTAQAPRPAGPISQGITAAGLVFVAGQGGFEPTTRELAKGIEAQTRQTLENIDAILRESGASLATVVKISVFLSDTRDFSAMNDVYRQFMPDPPPARTTVQTGLVVPGMLVEMDAVALCLGE